MSESALAETTATPPKRSVSVTKAPRPGLGSEPGRVRYTRVLRPAYPNAGQIKQFDASIGALQNDAPQRHELAANRKRYRNSRYSFSSLV